MKLPTSNHCRGEDDISLHLIKHLPPMYMNAIAHAVTMIMTEGKYVEEFRQIKKFQFRKRVLKIKSKPIDQSV